MQALASFQQVVNINLAWDQYTKTQKIDPIVRPVIAGSWKRCSNYNIDPFAQSGKEFLKGTEFQERFNRHYNLIRVALLFMQMLIKICGEDFVAVLGDEEGIILEDYGKSETLEWAKKHRIGKGFNLGERVVGTNTLGTVSVERVPIQVLAKEHYCKVFHEWTSSAAPIFGTSGDLIGVLCISGHYNKVHPHTLGMVIAAAKAIENQLHLEAANEELKREANLREIKTVNRLVGAKARFTFDDSIGECEVFQQAVFLARCGAASSSTILLQGESGTGKELFAQAIHNAGKRANGPFIAVNCGAIPRELIESELFGYEEGAFTGARRGGCPGKFELASGGTIFLDEIGDMPLDLQVILLRVLQEKVLTRLGGRKVIPVDVRVIAATHRDLKSEIKKGQFREDLFYRLDIFTINVPPLRERQEDIPLLAGYFVRKIGRQLGKPFMEISPQALISLTNYVWPGNVRELENALERAINVAPGDQIMVEHLPENLAFVIKSQLPTETGLTKLYSLQEIEYQTIIYTLSTLKKNIAQAARVLGVSRNTLYKKIQQYQIEIK
ncbi:MAG: sigma-54-dependent Fis family transcriptional regulator [Clostridia bacterium]|nr:sigma-54-dependent Fis family transcriptional regulator [Clostridia bacterium]